MEIFIINQGLQVTWLVVACVCPGLVSALPATVWQIARAFSR
jgi:hypothetical protein